MVSVATAGVTDTHLVQNGEIRKNRVDSIGVTKWCVRFRGSADSKGVAREMSACGCPEVTRIGRIKERKLAVSSAAYMTEDNRHVIAFQ